MPTERRAWLDMDPGIDDAVALMALAATERIAGITAVAGNHRAEHTFANARRLTRALGIGEILVAKGAACPLFYPLDTASDVHGERAGLEGADHLPEAPITCTGDAVDVMREALLESTAPLDLIATGPLTNIARLLMGSPLASARIGHLFIMGGSLYQGGNVSDLAEYNFYADPHAADIVLRSGVSTYVVGLDVTHQVLWRYDELDRLVSPFPSSLRQAFAAMLRHYTAVHRRYHPDWTGVAIHDAVAAAAWLQPGWFEWEAGSYRVETGGHGARGFLYRTRTGPSTVRVAINADREAIHAWLFRALAATAARLASAGPERQRD